jgi:hypothetical protein
VAVCAALFSVAAFATDYTWTGGGGDDHGWRTPANWGQTDNKYPSGTGDIALFTADAPVEVVLGADEKIKTMTIAAGATVVLKTDTAGTLRKIECTDNITLANEGISLTADGVYLYRNREYTLGAGSTLSLINGGQTYFSNFTLGAGASLVVADGSTANLSKLTATTAGATISVSGNSAINMRDATSVSIPVTVADGSTFNAAGKSGLAINNGSVFNVSASTLKVSGDLNLGGALTLSSRSTATVTAALKTKPTDSTNSALTLDDSLMTVSGYTYFSETAAGGARVTFKGANPVLKTALTVYSYNNAGATQPIMLNFFVPEGGFKDTPFQNTYTSPMFYNQNNLPAGSIKINVTNESPALAAGTFTTCPLIASRSGFYRWSSLPDLTLNTDVGLVFSNLASTAAATDNGSAQVLWATMGSGSAAASTVETSAILEMLPLAVSRHVVTMTAYASALSASAASTVAELYEGTADNKASMTLVDTVPVSSAFSALSFSFTADEDEGEVDHWFFARIRDLDSNGDTLSTAETATYKATTKDTTTYTWQAVNGDWNGDWHDTAHWTSDLPSAYGYPCTGNSTAVFPAGTNIIVTISDNEKVGTLDLSATKNLTDAATACGVDVTFKGATATGTNKVLTVSTLFNVNSALGTITLDNAAVKASQNNQNPGKGKRIRVTNGSNLYYGGVSIYNGSSIEVEGKSVARLGALYTGDAGSMLLIDDSLVLVEGECNLGAKSVGGTFVFKGANPRLIFTTNNKAFQFAGNQASKMVFHIPAGGFDEPVIGCTAKMTSYNLFDRNGKTTATVTFSVADDSPIYKTVAEVNVPLVNWVSASKAIDTSNLRYAEVADGGYFMLGTSATSDYGFVNQSSFSGTAKSLGVHVVSVAHDGRLTVASDAAEPLDGYEPALGETNGYTENDTVTLTAPTGVVSNDVRYTCTGYTLTEYAAGDAATVVSTATVTDGTSSFNYTFPAGRAEITWHYVESYPVTATTVNDAGATVALSSPYVAATAPITLTASTTTPGMEFQYWYGDVPYEDRYDNPLVISGDKAKSVTAFFGATAANGATRTLSYNGNVGKEWFDAAAWTGGVIPGTNDTAVLINTSSSNLHQSSNKGRVIAPSFVAVKNLVVSNAVLFVGARYARFDGGTYENSSPAQYWWTDQHGNGIYQIALTYDNTCTEPVGLDVFGDVILDSYNRSYANGNSGGAVFVGGTDARCETRVNVAGDFDIVNGCFQIVAGYPFDFVPDPSTAVNGGFIPFDHPEAFFRGGNYLKVAGKTFVRTPTATKTYSILHVVNDFRTGAAVWLDLNDVEVGEGAYITSYYGGYGKFNSSGNPTSSDYSTCPGGHQTQDTYDGGCHGGLGGKGNGSGDGYDNPTTYSTTYDYELTPMYPGNANGGGSNTRGAGSIRLDCTTLDLDGGLIATGHSGSKGGSAGGSIWVICDMFNAGDNCQVFAEGGNRNCGGGGGCIAICEGLTGEQVADLWATHAAPASVVVTDLADKLQSRVSVAGGTGVVGTFSKGYPGTARYLVNTAGKKTLTVAGDPANLGTPTPAYGPQIYDEGEDVVLVAPSDSFATADNRSRRVAVGYTITETATGDVVADSSATSDTIAITGDWTLTWKLTALQHTLDFGVATAGGSLVTNTIGAAGEVWQNDGAALSVTAVPASGWRFAGWTGEIDESAQSAATFATNVTGALRVRAVFVSDEAGTATWTGEGDGTSFLDAANWSTGKIPGPQNDVVIGEGASVSVAAGLIFNVKSLSVATGATLAILPEGTYSTRAENPHLYPETVALYDVHDCGLVASGDIIVCGTLVAGARHSLAKAKLAAGGDFTIAEGASVTVNGGYDEALIGATATPALWRNYGAVASAGGSLTVDGTLALYGDALSGSPVEAAANRLMIGATGVLHSDGGGWGWKNYHGANSCYALGAPEGLSSYNGAAYGGFGGGYNGTPASVTDYGNKKIYGEALRPYLPGSPGPNNDYPFGGGALRIVVAGQILNNGRISANGTQAGGSTGGGSGGSVWMSCSKFVNAAGATVRADGGNNTDNGGAGGGGRILVCERLDAAKLDALYATGVVPAKVTATEITDANLAEFSSGTISAAGGVNTKNSASYPCWSGTAGSIWWLRGRGLGTFIMVR